MKPRVVSKILAGGFRVGRLSDVMPRSPETAGGNPTLNRQSLFLRRIFKATGNFIDSSGAKTLGGATNNVSLSFVLAIFFGGQSPPLK